ncbi:MAG: aspartate carbamoyltransferase [Acidobacteria bacterium]|nr:MAG: aspartate carbamoyltransferase [Acidobacteriota bacterium]
MLSTSGLKQDFVDRLLAEAANFTEVLSRPIPVVPALRGTTVAMMFFENSTRTRISFELAARRLSAEVVSFTAPTSSVTKGESLRDTAETLAHMGANALVVRHAAAGVPEAMSRWVNLPVINAGDGRHEHPTQALIDLFTVSRHIPKVSGLRLTIVGDIENSRVARSNIWLFSGLGAQVTLVAPGTLLPAAVDSWPVRTTGDLDSILPETDVLMLLRIQRERGAGARLPSMREFQMRFGIDERRAALLPDGALILHPGPMNRDIEISPAVARRDNVLVGEQVANGVAVRMAVLYMLLAGGDDD